jgi:hypothetical protein
VTRKLAWFILGTAMTAGCAARQAPALGPEAAEACTGVSDSDVQSVRANVESVTPKYVANVGLKEVPATRLTGAVIYVRATQGATAEWLTRTIRCDASKDQRVVAFGAEVRTNATDTGFAVNVESSDPEIARRIWARSGELTAHR